MLSNFRLADEALNAAAALCEVDPLLCNERGVMAFNHGECVFLIGHGILFSVSEIWLLIDTKSPPTSSKKLLIEPKSPRVHSRPGPLLI